AYVREQAGERGEALEFNALVQRVVITDDRRAAAAELCEQVEGLTLEDALETPYLALGTHDEIAAHLQACSKRWRITYFTVRDVTAFAPVIARCKSKKI